ncbi:MAG: TonB-dependent receptor [Thermoanaerobaculum sp.]|nr:TonB-dependent receptor [Thermoanaerobaculum sp.]MDW7968746.1 TonB-dependent receptor [Thermoanaerobaculum sp.]
MLRKGIVGFGLLCLLGMGLAPPAWGQVTTATLTGKVVDEKGDALPGATVEAVNVASGFVFRVVSREDGSFTLANLPPGTYKVTVSLGNLPPQSETLELLLGHSSTVTFRLATEALFTEEVVVIGSRVVDTRSPEIATSITPEQLLFLPQRERNFINFAALAPGVYVDPREDSNRYFRGAAGSAKQVNAFVDGLSYKNDLMEGGAFMQDASRGNPFPQNAVQEFQVLTQNYKAEYEKSASAVITAVTKSGGNVLAGDFFYSYQNKDMVTLDRLSKERGFSKPDYKRQLAGLSLGGPFIKDKLHFFLSYEANRQDRFNQVFRGPQWDSARVPAALKQRLSQYPVGNIKAPFASDLYFGKLTWQPSLGATVDLSLYSRDEDERRGFGGQRVEEGAERFRISTDALVAKWSSLWGQSHFNELTLTHQEMRWFPSALGSPTPRQNYIGLLDVGSKDASQDFTQKRLGIREDLSSYFSWRGDHATKLGISANFMDYRIVKTLFPNAYYEYREAESWQYPVLARLGFGDPKLSFSNNQFGLYAQDDWRITPSLTISLGLRWDYESNMLNNDWETPAALLAAMRTACKTYSQPVGGKNRWCLTDFLDFKRFTTDGNQRDPYKGMIQPRLGFSWDASGKGTTVIYGGWGKYYDRIALNDIFDEKYRHTYKIYTFCFVPGACSSPIAWRPEYATPQGLRQIIASGQAPGPEVFLVANDMKPPRSDQWTLGVRHQLGRWLVGASYAGVRTYNLMAWVFADLPPGTSFNDRWSGQVPIPGYARAFKTSTARKTKYDAFYLTLDRPFTADSKWGANIAYTYGKAEAFGPGTDGVIFALDYTGPETFDWHPADYDERHRLVASGTVALPLGLRLSSILTLGSGTPFTIYDASRGWNNFRVRFGAGRFEKRSFLGIKEWVYRSVDLRLDWETPLFAGVRLGLSGEAFNVFNFVNEGCPGWGTGFIPPAGETNASFGKGECQFNTRRYQVGARISF